VNVEILRAFFRRYDIRPYVIYAVFLSLIVNSACHTKLNFASRPSRCKVIWDPIYKESKIYLKIIHISCRKIVVSSGVKI